MMESQLGRLHEQIATLQQGVIALIDSQTHILAALQATPSSPIAHVSRDALATLANQLANLRIAVEQSVNPPPPDHSALASIHLTELTVERINIVEPNGTLRMIIANAAREPDLVVDDQVLVQRGGGSAGITFYNIEGDECGALV